MSDVRFTLIGIVLIFIGFIVLGIFGSNYANSFVESQEFEDCYEYFDDKEPVLVDCNKKTQEKILFFSFVIGLIVTGVIVLVKGVKGTWDQDVKSEDMVGPTRPTGPESDKPE